MLMKNTVQLVQQVHIHRCLIVHNAITIVNSAKYVSTLVNHPLFSYQLSLTFNFMQYKELKAQCVP